MPYNPNAYSANGLHHGGGLQRYGFLPYTYPNFSIETTDPRTVTVPDQPAIQSGRLDTGLANADDMKRTIEQTTSGPVIQSSTSNLITCPNADGDVSLGCWLFSSENDRFMRKNLEVDAMPGEKPPDEIMVVPGNWMELAGTTASPGNYQTVTPDLYNTEVLDSEQRIFTGVMMNSNTGQLYETYEDDVPPPNTDKKRLVPEQMGFQNPIVTALSGGYDPSMPPRHKVEVLEVEYGADAGRNVWGPQLYATAIRDIAEQIDVSQQFNNRNGMVPIEPAWDKRAVGFVGYVSAYRGTPHMPPTQREARDAPDNFATSVRGIENLDIQLPAIHGTSLVETQSIFTNREAPAILSNESMAASNFAPGRIGFSPVGAGAPHRNRSGIASSQIYSDGHLVLKSERPVSTYSVVPDATVDHTVHRPGVEARTIRSRDGHAPVHDPSVSSGFAGIDYQKLPPTVNKAILKNDKSEHYIYSTTSDVPSQGQQRRTLATPRRTLRSDQNPANQYFVASDVPSGGQQRRTPATPRPTLRSDQSPGNQYFVASDVPSAGQQLRSNSTARATHRADTDPARARQSGDTALIGTRDGRIADESEFLASVKLVGDTSGSRARQLGVRNIDALATNSLTRPSIRLGKEGASSVRTQGFTTSISESDTVGGSRVADWTAHVRDTSVKTTRRGPVEFSGQHEERFRATPVGPVAVRGTAGDTFRAHGPNGVAATASTLANRDPYGSREDEVHRGFGTRDTSRGMRTVDREPLMAF